MPDGAAVTLHPCLGSGSTGFVHNEGPVWSWGVNTQRGAFLCHTQIVSSNTQRGCVSRVLSFWEELRCECGLSLRKGARDLGKVQVVLPQEYSGSWLSCCPFLKSGWSAPLACSVLPSFSGTAWPPQLSILGCALKPYVTQASRPVSRAWAAPRC